MLGMEPAHHPRAVPFLAGAGDLGTSLYLLMVGLEKLNKTAQTVQPCPCSGSSCLDNAATLKTEAAESLSAVYSALSGVLAACGSAEAARLVQGFLPTPEPIPCPPNPCGFPQPSPPTTAR